VSTDKSDVPPNILLIIWDACRYDYAVEHASFLNELGSSNLWFENAIAPSPWSLPSHASIFTGQYPHEHWSNRFGDSIDTPLVRELSSRGYTTYGVSANGFASQRTGFHENFDEFRYTGGRDVFTEGMDVSGISQDILRDEQTSQMDALIQVLGRIPGHDRSLKSLVNLAAVGVGELATKFESVQRIPHPVFAPTSDYSYTPGKNTRIIQSTLRNHDGGEPFFLFTNYMDTHRCYKPDDELQQKHLGRTLEYDELVRLNEEVAAPWEFESQKARGELEEGDVEDVRGLYAGEVETADRHLREVYDTLKEENLLDDTLIIVTADHGENLGETDEIGRRRMGHEASVSDAVLRVPFVVAHPDLDSETITDEIGLSQLYDICLAVAEQSMFSVDSLLDGIPEASAVSQYPATGGAEETLEKYPNVPEEAIHHRSSEGSAVVYDDGWKVVAESTGDQWAVETGCVVDYSEAPQKLVSLGTEYIETLSESSEKSLSSEQVSQLESLGYL
jgi:arylsulfatase A-like enzyme